MQARAQEAMFAVLGEWRMGGLVTQGLSIAGRADFTQDPAQAEQPVTAHSQGKDHVLWSRPPDLALRNGRMAVPWQIAPKNLEIFAMLRFPGMTASPIRTSNRSGHPRSGRVATSEPHGPIGAVLTGPFSSPPSVSRSPTMSAVAS